MTTQKRKRHRRTQSERRAESEERMLNAATELFAEQGLMKTTLLEIGKRAGYSGGLATHHFGSKMGIVEALALRFRETVSEKYMEEDENGEPRPVTWSTFFERYFGDFEEGNFGRRAMHVLMAESLGPLKEAADIFIEYNRWFTGIVEATVIESQRAGELDSRLSAHETALMIVSYLRGITLLWQTDPEFFKLEILVSNFKRNIEALSSTAATGPKKRR